MVLSYLFFNVSFVLFCCVQLKFIGVSSGEESLLSGEIGSGSSTSTEIVSGSAVTVHRSPVGSEESPLYPALSVSQSGLSLVGLHGASASATPGREPEREVTLYPALSARSLPALYGPELPATSTAQATDSSFPHYNASMLH